MVQDGIDIFFAEVGIYKGGLARAFGQATNANELQVAQTLDRPLLATDGQGLADIPEITVIPEERARAQDEHDLLRSQGDQSEGLAGSNGRQKRGGAATEHARVGNSKREQKERDRFARLADRVRADLERLEQIYKDLARLDREITDLERLRSEAHNVGDAAFDLAHEADDLLTKLGNGTATPEDLARMREMLGDRAEGKSDSELTALMATYIREQMSRGREATEEAERLRREIEERIRERNRLRQEAEEIETSMKANAPTYGATAEDATQLISDLKEKAQQAVKTDALAAREASRTTGNDYLEQATVPNEHNQQDLTDNSAEFDDSIVIAIPPLDGPS